MSGASSLPMKGETPQQTPRQLQAAAWSLDGDDAWWPLCASIGMSADPWACAAPATAEWTAHA